MMNRIDSCLKEGFDKTVSLAGLLLTSPVILIALLFVWAYDFKNPFYVPLRIGKKGVPFRMLKIRSMVVDADKNGVDSTSADDKRITTPGHWIRKLKLDELVQLYNVLKGDMSFVGPRPNVATETNLYTELEQGLLRIRPGITDLSSIVFSDLAEILQGSTDANLLYNQKVRPWKSRLGLFYIEKKSFLLDIVIIMLTLVSIVSRPMALTGVITVLRILNAPEELVEVSRRNKPLKAFPPPGSDAIVSLR